MSIEKGYEPPAESGETDTERHHLTWREKAYCAVQGTADFLTPVAVSMAVSETLKYLDKIDLDMPLELVIAAALGAAIGPFMSKMRGE